MDNGTVHSGLESLPAPQNILQIMLTGNDDNDTPPIFDPRSQTHNLFKVQLFTTSILGLTFFLLFCVLRYNFPIIFSVRSFRNKKIQKLPNSLFGWIGVVISINNDQLLQVIGLDSYVFLRFFRMGIKILTLLSVLGLFILSPLRYYLTGTFDKDTDALSELFEITKKGTGDDTEPTSYLAITTFFTYIFTGIIYWCLFAETNHIIRTRQKFLGSQRTLTDRTIYLQDIPEHLQNELGLKAHVEELSVGKVEKINFVHDYSSLVNLFKKRSIILDKLEVLYSRAYGLDINLFKPRSDHSVRLNVEFSNSIPDDQDILYTPLTDTIPNSENEYPVFPILSKDNKKRYGKLSFFGPKIDLIDYYSRELVKIDDEIKDCKLRETFKTSPHAFITMYSVTDAQLAAQAVFSPKVSELTSVLAPAPLDIIWENLLMNKKTIFVRRNIIEGVIIAFSILLIIPIRYITSLLNVNSIRKMWREFGDYLIKNSTARAIVTGLLPTYLFTIINVALPYVISFLSKLQGMKSKGDVELSVIKKNFLYTFFNLFLVFTLFGTLSSYKALLTDTTKIAPLLATSIKSLSLFYVDLILLQGLTMFPFKLIQIGDLAIIFWNTIVEYKNRTPRMFNEWIYKPAIFDLGMILPQHLMILLLTMIYSPISTKILISGLVYFILGFYTYKYQLVYSLVHPYHSTGKAWPIIFKRVCLGVFVLHVQMFGSLALEQAFVLAGLILPLFPATLMALLFFDRNYKPLLYYIALDAIKTKGQSVGADTENFDVNGSIGLDRLINSSGIAHKSSIMSFNGFLDGEENNDAVLINSSEETSSHSNFANDEESVSENPLAKQRSNLLFSGAVKIKSNELPHISENSSLVSLQGGSIGSLNIISNNSNSRFTPIPDDGNSETGINTNVLTKNKRNNNDANDNNDNNYNNNTHANKKLNRRSSTIEEQREIGHHYMHPALSDPLEGIMVGFQEDVNEYLETREIQLSSANKNNRNDNGENPLEDNELGKSVITGFVVSRQQQKEVW